MDAVFPKPCKPYFGCEQADTFAVDAELRKAVEFQQNGRLAAAEGLYLNILKYYPEQPDALHLLGVIAHQKGSHDEAERLICRAIRIVPGNPYYLNNLGAVYKAKGKLPEAISCYKNAIQLKPHYLDAHVNLARAFHVLKEFRQAEYYYQKAIELSPDLLTPEAWAYHTLITQIQKKESDRSRGRRSIIDRLRTTMKTPENIGFVSTRFAGTDGVSLEAAK